jgi:hypothetical protein
VTDHARGRFRSRIGKKKGEQNNGTEHRGDDDINNWIDSLVCSAIADNNWEDIIDDDGSPAQLVDIRHPTNRDDLWAIVKDNTSNRSRTAYPRAIVTLLYTWMVNDSKRSGKWELTSYDDGDVSIGGLGKEAREILQSITPAQEDEPTKMPEGTPSRSGALLITYLTKGGEKRHEEWADVEAAEKNLNQLRRDARVDNNSIRVFREIIPEARIVL